MASLIDTERQFHIATLPDEVGGYVILPGDPFRVPKIAQYINDAKQVAHNREFNVYTGTLCGEKVTVCSTGIGGASAAIATEELVKCGAHTFIRIGTCGGMNDRVSAGDLIVATAAVRGEGTSYEYMPTGYPAAADFTVTTAIADAAKALSDSRKGNGWHAGVVHSKDSFYGQLEPDNSPVSDKVKSRWDSYIRLGCLASEMECAALFSVGQARDVRCGAVLASLWNCQKNLNEGADESITLDTDRAIRCSVEAIKLLISRDKEGR